MKCLKVKCLIYFSTLICLAVLRNDLADQPTQSEKTVDNDYIVTGTLITKDGLPVSGKIVYLFITQGGQAFANLGMINDKIQVVSPSAESDKKGRFKITFGKSFIEKYKNFDYTVGLYDKHPLPLNKDGIMIVFGLEVFDKKTKNFDIGKVINEVK